MYQYKLSKLLHEPKYHNTVKYGPDVQGSKNKLITIHTKNAHVGDATFCVIFFMFGLQALGTSIMNHFPYQKKSFMLASQTSIPSTQTVIFTLSTLVASASIQSNLYTHTHIKK